MDHMTINIADRDSVGLKCSLCGYATHINISQLIKSKRRIYKIRCICNDVFNVSIDRRKYKRRVCNLNGTYSVLNSSQNNIININNFSQQGIRFTRSDNNVLKKNDRINVSFNLDNADHDVIECNAIVRNLFNNTVCVQLEEMNARMQTALGFYFLPVTVQLEMSHS